MSQMEFILVVFGWLSLGWVPGRTFKQQFQNIGWDPVTFSVSVSELPSVGARGGLRGFGTLLKGALIRL